MKLQQLILKSAALFSNVIIALLDKVLRKV